MKPAFRFLISVVWCLLSVALGVFCMMVNHWLLHFFAVGCAFSAVVSFYVAKQEWKLL